MQENKGKSRILHEMGYLVEKEPLEHIQPSLAGELVLGPELVVQNLMDPGHVVTELWG
jgi:hypothetical protein